MTHNAFTHHGIGHLSPSSINLWIRAPGIWSLKYLKRFKDDGGPALWRGTAVETGGAALLRGQPLDEATRLAYQTYDMNAQGEISDEIAKERNLIADMVAQFNKWKPPSELMATQVKVEHWFSNIPVPVIGYVDLGFECRDVDLKSTSALPSAPRPAHVRQVALYRAARCRDQALLYVTPKKHALYEIDDAQAESALADVEEAANSLYEFLGRVDSADDAVRCLPVDKDDYQYPKQAMTTEPKYINILAAG